MYEDELRKISELFPSRYKEVRYHSVITKGMRYLNGKFAGIYNSEEEGFSVRTFNNGVLQFYASPNSTEIKPVGESLTGWEAGVSEEPVKSAKYESEEKVKLSSMSIDSKISYLNDVLSNVMKTEIKGKVKSLVFSYVESVETKEIMISDSDVIMGRVPRVLITYNIVLEGNGRTVTAWFEEGGSGGLEWLIQRNLQEKIEENLRSIDRVMHSGKGVTPGKKDVILSPILSGIMAHESVGHPFEMDRILGREFAQAGSSYLTEFKEDQVGSNVVNLSDNPTIPTSSGFYLIDDQGVSAREKKLIVSGKVNEMLQDRFTGFRTGRGSNGSARSSRFDREPLIRMSNTYFVPGEMSFEELVEDVREGIYFKNYMEWNIDDMRLGQRYIALEAYAINNGEIGEPLLFPVLEGTTTYFLKSVDGVDRNLDFKPGMCGKGDPEQGVPVWLGGPNMRLRNVNVKVM
ncbi:hypothetical protein HS7_02970 [Sulfolobales archaeon HS-7]|nr:hypothetical protein HS7_02970 [Sulfolobales archaeon HS-7]